LEDLDVGPGFLADLALKTVSLDAECTTARVAQRLRVGVLLTNKLLEQLVAETLIEKKGMATPCNYRYGMLERGWDKVDRLMNVCSYVGPAPVSLKTYTEMITGQVRCRRPVPRAVMDRALSHLLLSETTKRTLALVSSSGRSLFLSGPSGNGKTAMARALVDAIPGSVWIPYAIEVDGQVIRVFDSHNHQTVEPPRTEFDHRWVRIRPPLVVVGGELTIQSLDITCPDLQRLYEAPFQVKANGGVLVVDDLGRQRCSARELLNRWINPLENGVDYLTLSTGKKLTMPFEQTVVFATNLTGADLEDEAFLRRMGYRLTVRPPNPNTYATIFNRYAQSRSLVVDPHFIVHVLGRYADEKRTPKCCEPRDLIERALDLCKVRAEPNQLTTEILDAAWDAYFGVSR
jgi:predicted ATPase with chaperone activity